MNWLVKETPRVPFQPVFFQVLFQCTLHSKVTWSNVVTSVFLESSRDRERPL